MSNKIKQLVTTSIFTFSLIISQHAFSFSGGVNGYSGNPATNAGSSCSSCHSGGAIPTVNLTGPTNVQPASISTFTFTLSGGQQNSGGLDVSADGGTLINTQTSTRLQATEIIHNQRASAAADGTISWSFEWRAPATPGSYILYGAGLSTNGDSNTTLDAVASIAYSVTVSSAAPQSPTAVIQSPMTAELNTVVSFDASASSDPDGIINQYQWDFSDGSTATGAQVTRIFNAAGNYTANLTVTDSDNLTSSTFRDIAVGGVMVPIANPSGPYTGSENQAINFDASLSNHIEPITRYIWDFGDGTAITQTLVATTTHTYSQPGAYILTLAVQDANTITGVANTTVVISTITPPPPPPPPAVDGPTLYANYCANCHGVLASSSKLNKTAIQIQTAIDNNIGSMGALSNLTPTEVQAIADALANVTTPPLSNGEERYIALCQSCHGLNGTGGSAKAVIGISANQITTAINAITVMQNIVLTNTDAQDIADFLVSGGTQPPPTTGEGIYALKCAACHGATGNGGSAEGIIGVSAMKILKAMQEVTEMQPIPLTNAEAQALETYLSNDNDDHKKNGHKDND